ncbi:MarR family winged helix-turn-helix transcriptional regulator [Georgenia sunbinii]|uniref:MarR family winged helix-turn-helix transcriptional regulator n=1 Tax=Georgenia sunbinii TaxID=3117728 RepID=UPI002F269A09
MTCDPIVAVEYEAMVFGRHLTSLPGRSRRSQGVLDTSAYTLLALLQVGGPASIRQLSAITGLDASTLNRQTAALLRDHYAERIPDPDGGVARKFRITGTGERALEEERAASREALAALTADWTEADRVALGSLLGRLNRAVEQRSGRAWPRPAG